MTAAVDSSVVAGMPLFADLGANELNEILKGARSIRYRKESRIFHQGADADAFFILIDGLLRVEQTTAHGEQIVVRYVSAGEPFGIARALGLKHYPATAVSVVESLVLSWPSEAWPRFAAKFPRLGTNVLQTVGSRLQDTQARFLEVSTEQVEQRIAHALLRLAKQAGSKVEAGIEINYPITQRDIAEMTGTTLYTVSRIMSTWEQQGLIRASRGHILIRHPHKLTNLAEGRKKGS